MVLEREQSVIVQKRPTDSVGSRPPVAAEVAPRPVKGNETVKRLAQANWIPALARQISNPQSPGPQQRLG